MEVCAVRLADWQQDGPALRHIRETVFVEEQKVPPTLEWDEFDAHALHFIATNSEGAAVGTARLLPGGTIGRMAVLKEWRGQGIGNALVRHLLEEAKKLEVKRVVLSAQTQAVAFYEKVGFCTEGNEFLEAGIPHVKMVLKI